MRTDTQTTGEQTPATGVTGLAHDIVELGELQAVLLMLDMKAASRRIRAMTACGVAGIALLFACIPVLLVAVAEFLVEQFGWTQFAALGVTGIVALFVSLATIGCAWLILKHGFSYFKRSREEMHHNVAWLKSVLCNGSARTPGATSNNDATRG